jgi:hypothetical protein
MLTSILPVIHHRFHLRIASWMRASGLAGICLGLSLMGVSAQTVFLNFNTAGQYTANFNEWNDTGGVNGGNYSFTESASGGVNDSGCVSVLESSDTTATYKSGSWDFSTNGATVVLSVMVKANGQSSGDKVQLGLMNVNNNGLNDNAGVAFESFRFVPSSATVWSLREQYRSGGTLTETPLGNVNITVGDWYKFVVTMTNTDGSAGNYSASCALYDFGADGISPGSNVVTFSTLVDHTGQTDVTDPAVWPALRAFQDAGISAWDNFLAFTKNSQPVMTIPLTGATVVSGHSLKLSAYAEGPGSITYAWYTNGVLDSSASGFSYTTPPLDGDFTNVTVVASNSNGSVTNSAVINVVTPTLASITNLPASSVQATLATLNGQVLLTGNSTPTVTLYYGPTDGGTNAAAWAESVSLGVQTGSFAQTVDDLSSNSTYYYTAKAVNSVGIVWATPAEMFTTALSNSLSQAVGVLTQHNDNFRTGDNLKETALNIYDVNTNQFGLLASLPVDDQIYAQPLVMTNVNIPGKGTHNLVIVATVNDSVYAYDADNPLLTTPYWKDSFIDPPNVVPPRNTDMTGACGGDYEDFSGNIGIVSTPVIDPTTGTLYVLARTKENGTTFFQRLHALDIATGAERSNSPVVVTATYPGTGDGSVDGVLTFDPQRENQRPGLALVNGMVYISWASHCDWGPYHGWVMGYNATNLQREVVWNDTPNGSEGGIWMSGQAPAADTNGNIYLTTGNGTVDANDYGESFVKLTPANGTMDVTSYFTPYNWSSLNAGDVDLNSAGMLLIPGTTLGISGGKQGVLYVVNRNNMGGLSSGDADTNIVQSWSLSSSQIHGTPVWWTGPDGSYIYVWPQSRDHLRQYQFSNGSFNTTTYATGPNTGGSGSPGGILSVSSDGTNAGSGIIWAAVNTTGDANQSVVAGTLHAYSAENVGDELWNSDMRPSDALGYLAKFVPPTVANGKVYMATFSDVLNVYGLLPPPRLTVVSSSSGSLSISWPDTYAGYQLQSRAELNSGAWSDVNPLNLINTNGTLQVTLPETGTTTFYRLKL